MKITSIISTNYINRQLKPYFHNVFSQCNSDVFVKSTSFSGKTEKFSDSQSYEEFVKWAEETDFYSQVCDVVNRTGPILGSGFEGETYGIPNNDKWVVKQYKRGSLIPKQLEKPHTIKHEDFSPELNVGQSIGRIEVPSGKNYANVYHILKRQTGQSIGISLKFATEVSADLNKIHINSLEMLANAPQKVFDKCIEDVKYITKQGYIFDTANPYNFMFDKEKESINFVDINDKLTENRTQYGEVLYALLDGKYALLFNDSDSSDKAIGLNFSDKIIRKYFDAMIKSNEKFSSGQHFTQLLDSTLFDRVLNTSSKEERINKLKQLNLM